MFENLNRSRIATFAQIIAKKRLMKDEKSRRARSGVRFKAGLLMFVVGVSGTAGTAIIAAQFGLPTYAIFFGLIVGGLYEMFQDG